MIACRMNLRRRYPWTIITLMAFSGTGCKKAEESYSILPLEGKVEKINARSDGTGEITVTYTDKKQQSITGIGEVTAETEIMVNGAAAKLKDIREGDHVRGQVRIEKKSKERRQIAVSIHVDRAQPVTPDK